MRARLFFRLFVLVPLSATGCQSFDWSVDWNEVFSDLGSTARRALPKTTAPPSDPESVDETPLAGATQPPSKSKKPVAGAPVVQKSLVDLGVAYAPEDDTSGKKVPFAFDTFSFTPRQTHVTYAAMGNEVESVRKFYADYARSVHFKPTGKDTFTWAPPSGCPNDMGCVYAALIQRTRADVLPIAKRFLARVQQAGYDSMQTAELLVTFVQSIPYVSPEDPFGLRPPTLTLAEKGGDCDTKSLLLHMMLSALGIDSVIISSTAHGHTMTAIALPVHGTTFTYQGRRYAFTETTAIGSPIGYVSPDLLKPNDWRVEFAPSMKSDE
jgi:hypothetical protein